MPKKRKPLHFVPSPKHRPNANTYDKEELLFMWDCFGKLRKNPVILAVETQKGTSTVAVTGYLIVKWQRQGTVEHVEYHHADEIREFFGRYTKDMYYGPYGVSGKTDAPAAEAARTAARHALAADTGAADTGDDEDSDEETGDDEDSDEETGDDEDSDEETGDDEDTGDDDSFIASDDDVLYYLSDDSDSPDEAPPRKRNRHCNRVSRVVEDD